jgi:hypothetical protein
MIGGPRDLVIEGIGKIEFSSSRFRCLYHEHLPKSRRTDRLEVFDIQLFIDLPTGISWVDSSYVDICFSQHKISLRPILQLTLGVALDEEVRDIAP